MISSWLLSVKKKHGISIIIPPAKCAACSSFVIKSEWAAGDAKENKMTPHSRSFSPPTPTPFP